MIVVGSFRRPISTHRFSYENFSKDFSFQFQPAQDLLNKSSDRSKLSIRQVTLDMKDLFGALGVTVTSSSSSSQASSSPGASSSSSVSQDLNLDAATLFSTKGVLKKNVGAAHKGWTLTGCDHAQMDSDSFRDAISLLNDRLAERSAESIVLTFQRRRSWEKYS